MGAREAAAILDVKLPTLYAYVSRGLVRSVAGPRGRPRRYVRSDIERLRARRDARRGHGAVAAGALRWGEPVLDSAISEIVSTGHRYRGHEALQLAQERSFEDVAELLWTGVLPPLDASEGWSEKPDRASVQQIRKLLPEGTQPIAVLAALVPILAARDPDRHDGGAEMASSASRARARRILATMAMAVGPVRGRSTAASARPQSLAGRLLDALSVSPPSNAPRGSRWRRKERALNRALILCADHELNVSTFATRVTASAGSDLYACISAGLAAVSGPRHGGMSERVEALLRECSGPERAQHVIRGRAQRGEEIPGFGHQLYPDGDPRAQPLLSCARELAPKNRSLAIVAALIDAMSRAGRQPANVDTGLVALASALRLRPHAASAIFAVGRVAGWIAHMFEQRAAGFMLRPRARYVQLPHSTSTDVSVT